MIKPLRTTQLRHPIEIRRAAQASDGAAGFVETWTTVATLMASVEGFAPARDNERMIAGAKALGVNYRFRTRFRDGILNSDQIRYAGMDLNVTAAFDPDGRRQQLWITATDASAKVTG